MKETVEFLRATVIEAVDVAKLQWRSFAVSSVIVIAGYLATLLIEPGIVTYLLAIPPATVCLLTAIARVNDIGVQDMATRWHVRRLGLTLAAAGTVMLMAAPFIGVGVPISWRTVFLIWGVALVWLTTPAMPPWWHYITGEFRKHPKPYPRSPLDRAIHRVADTQKRRLGDGDGP